MGDERASRTERHLAMAQQLTHTGSWEWDLATNAVTWSDELYRIYGLEPRSCEITFESFLARVHTDDRASTTAEVKAAIARGSGRFEYPERIVRPDGSVRQLFTVGEVELDADGRVTGLLGACRDVTLEVERDETISLFEDFFQNAQIALAVLHVVDPADAGAARLVSFNPAAELVARRPLVDMLGAELRKVIPYAVGGVVETLVGDVAREGAVKEARVLRSRDPRDPERALAIKGFPLPGSCVGLAIDDITKETRARRLRDSEARVLEMIATGAALGDVLDAIARSAEEEARGARATIFLCEGDGELRTGAPSAIPEDLARSAATEVARKKAPSYDAERWAMPFFAKDGRLLGVLVVAAAVPALPRENDVDLLSRASRVAGIAVEKALLEERMVALTAHLESAREDERTGIARELHDALGQMLTALKLDLAWLGRRAAGETVASEIVRERVAAMSEMTDEVIASVRRMSSELRPGVLDDLGLAVAIEWQSQEFERRTQVPCAVHVDVDGATFDPALSTTVFRIFQEALTNVARHAEATRVDVSLAREGPWLHLEVRDDGKGITEEEMASPRSLGLLGIRERARRLGGEATIAGGGGGRGTAVSLRLPLSPGKP